MVAMEGQAGKRRTAPGVSSPVRLVWHPAYACGDAEIDRQHRGLIDAADRLLDAVVSNAPAPRVLALGRALVADVAAHFAAEERLLARVGYPQLREHALEHLALLEKAARVAERAASGGLAPGELFQFLACEVIVQHLLGADRHYFAWIEPSGSGVRRVPD